MTKSISLDRVMTVGEEKSSPTLPLYIKTTGGELVKVNTVQSVIWVVWCRCDWNNSGDVYNNNFYFLDRELASRKLQHIQDNYGQVGEDRLVECGMYPDNLHLNKYLTSIQLELFQEVN
jgi:hypothetical protein